MAQHSCVSPTLPMSAGSAAGRQPLCGGSVHSGKERGSAGAGWGWGLTLQSFLSKNRRKQIGTGSRGPAQPGSPVEDVRLKQPRLRPGSSWPGLGPPWSPPGPVPKSQRWQPGPVPPLFPSVGIHRSLRTPPGGFLGV